MTYFKILISTFIWQCNNKKDQNKEDSIFDDQKVEQRQRGRYKRGKKNSQFLESDCVEFLDSSNFDNVAVDNDYINYLDNPILTYHMSTDI